MDQAVMVFDDATERDVALGTAVVSEGMVTYLGDVDALSFYDGAAWRTLGSVSGLPVVAGGTGGTTVAAAQDNLRVGFVPISPTSIVVASGTATVNPLGQIVVTGASTLNVNGVFTSNFKNYKIILGGMSGTVANAVITFKLRGAGTDATGNYYVSGVSAGSGGLAVRNQINTASYEMGVLAGVSNVYHSFELELRNPQTALNTTLHSRIGGSTSVAVYSYHEGGFHNLNTSYDGFSIIMSLGVFSANSVQVYGYND
jgi:hypothetical protein